jgi:hypothetical protein
MLEVLDNGRDQSVDADERASWQPGLEETTTTSRSPESQRTKELATALQGLRFAPVGDVPVSLAGLALSSARHPPYEPTFEKARWP